MIFQKENPVLREQAHPVALDEIGSERIQRIIRDMKKAMHEEPDAVAIAAPQIGESLRIFVVSGKVFDEADAEKETAQNDRVFINPEILKKSRDTALMEEGCLSCRWLYGKTRRAQKATVRAFDETGHEFTRGASGLLAQIFQHETDHLDGVLFIDKAEDIREVPPDNSQEHGDTRT